MDNLTHSLFALTLARTPLGRQGRGTTAALLLASNAPDIDIVATAGGAANYLEWHRGPTHGPLGVIGLGLIVAALVSLAYRVLDKEGTRARASLRTLWILSGVGVLCHVLMDLPTSYGTRALSPFSWTWMAKDWLPIIDIYLLVILALGLLFDMARSRRTRTDAPGYSGPRRVSSVTVALVFMGLNYGLHAFAHHRAIVLAPQVFGALPPPCADAVSQSAFIDRWPRPSSVTPRDRAATRCLVEIAALPDFVSPFRWRLVAQLSNAYEVRRLDLLARESRLSDDALTSTRYPNQWTPAVQEASASRFAQVFLEFSRFPAVRSQIDMDGNAFVQWTDIRFDAEGTRGTRRRGANLFGATIEVGADGTILSERLGS